MPDVALPNLTVIEAGPRIATAVCGSLLAQLGATVICLEYPQTDAKWRHRRQFTPASKAWRPTASDRDLLTALSERADVLLTSSDMPTPEGISPSRGCCRRHPLRRHRLRLQRPM